MNLGFKVILGIVGVVFILGVGFKVIDYNLRPSSIEENIFIQATLRKNDSDRYEDCDYILHISAIKKKDMDISIYPYMEGKTRFNLPEEQYDSTGLLINLGFPYSKGTYETSFYVNTNQKTEDLEKAYLECIYTELKLWKQSTWRKTIPITVQQ